jgi:4-hydroxy-tetrahydrodipicolinate reductase
MLEMDNTAPRLALIGYGKMGHELELLAPSFGMSVAAIIDPAQPGYDMPIGSATLADADVCIEMSTPETAVGNILACIECGRNVVVGTTGWYDRMPEVEEAVRSAGTGLMYASNFLIGIHLFAQVVRNTGALFNGYAAYDAAIHETHHNRKKDAPSGTALMLARVLLDTFKRKTGIDTMKDPSSRSVANLVVSSSRVGGVPGTHTVVFDGEYDTIELTHTLRNRRALAEGALMAARWIHGKHGFFTIEDMIDDNKSV